MKAWTHLTGEMVKASLGLSDADMARALRLAGVAPRDAQKARGKLPKAPRKGRAS